MEWETLSVLEKLMVIGAHWGICYIFSFPIMFIDCFWNAAVANRRKRKTNIGKLNEYDCEMIDAYIEKCHKNLTEENLIELGRTVYVASETNKRHKKITKEAIRKLWDGFKNLKKK